jgi:hypothetical protein
MVSLIDIAELQEPVTIRGQTIMVSGISTAYLAKLLAGSEELRKIVTDQAMDGDIVTRMIAQVPDLVARVIAAAVGQPDDPKIIAVITERLGPQEWLDLLEAILRLTFPRGVKSFIEGLIGAARQNGLAVSGWDQGTNSQEPSPSSLPKATLPRAPGATLPDK